MTAASAMQARATPIAAVLLFGACTMSNPAFDQLDANATDTIAETKDGETGDGDGEPGDGDGETGDGDGEPGDGDGEPGDGDGEPGDGDGEPGCGPPLSGCAGVCVNLQTDANNCGECGVSCDGTCEAGDCVEADSRFVFVTSELRTGALAGLEGADSLCAELAALARLDGEYKAWLSTAQLGPAQRMTPFAGPYRLPDGTLVANGWADLTDGSLAHPISQNEHGEPGPDSFICEGAEVWTNTKPDGSPASQSDCGGWLTGDGITATTGRYTAGDASWTQSTCVSVTCASPLPVYCIGQ